MGCATPTQAVGIIEAAGIGARQTWFWTRVIFETLARLFQGRVSASDLGGPIMIAQEAGRRAAHGLDFHMSEEDGGDDVMES